MNIDMYLKAKDLIKEKKYDEALQILEILDNKYPNDEYVEFSLAKIKVKDKRTREEAKYIFKKLLSSHNEHSSASLLELGKIDLYEKEYSKARAKFNKLIKRENDTLAYIELAKLEAENRNYEEARKILEYVISIKDQYYEGALLTLVKVERKSGNILNAKKYLEQIPINSGSVKMPWVIFETAKIEILCGNFEKSINLLESIINTNINVEVIAELVSIYIKLEKYDLAYQYNQYLLCKGNGRSKINPRQIDTFLKYKLGIDITYDKQTYFTLQLCSYSKEETLKHIKTHLDENSQKMVHSVFSEIIDIEEIYDFAKEKIDNMEPIKYSMNDRYILRCNKIIGTTTENQLTDTILVIVIPNTKDILTIYPFPAENKKLQIEQEKIKQKKRETQIEKFNRRYSKNSY